MGDRRSLAADLAFMALLIGLFVVTAYIALDQGNLTFHLTALCVVFAMMIVTHFTSVTAGLVANVALIFAYTSYLIYRLFGQGVPIGFESYFWIVASPVFCTLSAVVFTRMRETESENREMHRQLQELSTIDDKTGLKNLRAYRDEAKMYRAIAIRYGMKMVLLVWELRYEDELKRILGGERMDDVMTTVSQTMLNAFRREDVVYLLKERPALWGTLMLVKPDTEQILMRRLRTRIEGIDWREALGRNAPRIEVRIGAQYDNNPDDPPDLIMQRAIANMDFDV